MTLQNILLKVLGVPFVSVFHLISSITQTYWSFSSCIRFMSFFLAFKGNFHWFPLCSLFRFYCIRDLFSVCRFSL